VQFLRLGTLGFPIEFKHIVAFTNEIQTMLFFPRIFKFNAVMYYPFIIILQQRGKKKKKESWIFMCKILKKIILYLFYV
jgi:hypothetical protein